MARSLRIPESQAAALARLVRLTPAEHGALSRALSESTPGFSIKGLASQVSEKAGLGQAEAYGLVRLLSALYRVRDRQPSRAGDFLGEVQRAARETEHADLTDARINWDEALRRIGELLGHSSSLGVTAKALDVLTDHERVFCEARVLTDIRPVFAADVHNTPDALLIVHELRISYHGREGEELDAVYVAMDSSDVQALREILDRASEKEATLEKLAEQTRVPVLKARSHGA